MKIRNFCPGCLSSSHSTLYQEPYSGPGITAYLTRHYEGRASDSAAAATYELARCNGCGLTFQKFVPDDRLLDEIYNAWIPGTHMDQVNRDYSLEEYRYLAEQIQFLIQHFALPPSELEVLDFGFGWGHWSRMAMAYGCKVSGVELSNERRDHGKSMGIQVFDLADLPSKRFRFIHTEQVFEHLTEPGAVLERLVDSLAPDGLVKISVPDAGPALRKLGQGVAFGTLSPCRQQPIAPLEHVNSFDYRSLVSFGKAVGLKPIRPSFLKLYNSASGMFEAKNLLRVLSRPFYRHLYPRSTFVYFQRS